MSELEVLNLEHLDLRTLVLKEDVLERLKLVKMNGNPLHCDCHARWLWNLVVSENATTNILLPNCQTPFSARGVALSNLPGNF